MKPDQESSRAGGRRFRPDAEADSADSARPTTSIEVVGTAMDGNFCLKKIEELKPKWSRSISQMPGMSGIDTLKEIMRRHPLPVIVVSSHSTEGRFGHV